MFALWNKIDVSDNAICAPYPSCIDDFGKQNTVECLDEMSADGYIYFEGDSYYYEDIQVLLDFTYINDLMDGVAIPKYPPRSDQRADPLLAP